MGTTILGWVEVKTKTSTGRWRGIIKIEHLMLRNYAAFGYLFGATTYLSEGTVAANRGIPQDASPEVLGSLLEDGYMGPSWVTWEEMVRSKLLVIAKTDDWLLLIDLMDRLATDYGVDGVRLVVAFL